MLQRLAWQATATTTEVTNTDQSLAEVTLSLEPLDHAAQAHQALPNFKRLGYHSQGEAFHKTFHMNFPWVKVVFVSKIIFLKFGF